MRTIMLVMMVSMFGGCDYGKKLETGAEGPKGDKGDQGEPGQNGEDGAIGPQGEPGQGIKLCPDEHQCDEGEVCNSQGYCSLPGANGEDGEDGANGNDGIDGEDGEDGTDGQDGEDATLPFDLCDVSASGTCDEGEVCNSQGLCIPVVVTPECTSDAHCTDNNACTGVERCVGGTCEDGLDLNCNDSNPYTVDKCLPADGCQHTPPGCSANTQCASDEYCSGNTCKPVVCNDSNLCTNDVVSNHACVYTAKTCNDNNGGTEDSCNPSTGCVYTPVGCSSNSQCGNTEYCAMDRTCKPVVCNDSNLCTNDVVSNHACVYTAKTCNDGNQGTTDSCSPATGCVYTPIGCTSNSQCGASQYCSSGTCVALNCNDNNACTNDSISNHACVNATKSCDDGDPLTTDSCYPASGCHYEQPDCRKDSDCDDGNGQTTDTCNITAGTCVYTPVANLCAATVDCDHDGYTGAQGDCDDEPTQGGAPASICHSADRGLFLVINYQASYTQRPSCPAGSTLVNTTDGSYLNGPQIAGHDTQGDGFDSDCDGATDEGEPGLNNCTWNDQGSGTWLVDCPFWN